jgi:ribonuclease VapC
VIVDTSVIVAVLLREPEAPGLERSLASAPERRMSAASYVELCAVIDGKGDPVLSAAIDRLLASAGIELVAFSTTQARMAREAYQRFGRGSGHPAQLNMGDCFAYALARDLGEPLLFKGRDFALTDIELVVEPVRERRLSEVLAAYVAGTSVTGA